MVQFASYLRRVLHKMRLIFLRINGPIITLHFLYIPWVPCGPWGPSGPVSPEKYKCKEMQICWALYFDYFQCNLKLHTTYVDRVRNIFFVLLYQCHLCMLQHSQGIES